MTILTVSRATRGTVRQDLRKLIQYGYSSPATPYAGSRGLESAQFQTGVFGTRYPTAYGYGHRTTGVNLQNGTIYTRDDPADMVTPNSTATIALWICQMPSNGDQYFLFRQPAGTVASLRINPSSQYNYAFTEASGTFRAIDFPTSVAPQLQTARPGLLVYRHTPTSVLVSVNGRQVTSAGRAGWSGTAVTSRMNLFAPEVPSAPGTFFDWYFFERDLSDPELNYLYQLGPGGLYQKTRSYFIPKPESVLDYKAGINFRATAGYVTDGTDQVPAVSADGLYPQTKYAADGTPPTRVLVVASLTH